MSALAAAATRRLSHRQETPDDGLLDLHEIERLGRVELARLTVRQVQVVEGVLGDVLEEVPDWEIEVLGYTTE